VIDVRLDELGGERGDEVFWPSEQVDSLAVADVHQTLGTQGGDRLADGGTPHRELLGKFSLGHETVAGLQLVHVDELAEPVTNLFVDGFAVYRPDLGSRARASGHICSSSSRKWMT
jgi:hypothetical protein